MSEKIYQAIKHDIEKQVLVIDESSVNKEWLNGFKAGSRESIRILREWLVDIKDES